MTKENRKMKDSLGPEAIQRLAHALSATLPDFDLTDFAEQAIKGVEPLELKERVQFLIELLYQHLPSPFPETAKVLKATKQYWDTGNDNDPLRGFAAWPLIDYVAAYGLDHPDEAIPLLAELTPLFSSEMAIRPFLLNHFEQTYAEMERWCTNENEHVRRLVSEGSRPRLPWAMQLKPFIAEPEPVIRLLERLKDDESLYVRRSVANNLNDIAKDHPGRVVAVCKSWQNGSKNRDWIIRHATRTLVKQGHPGALALLGFTENPELSVQGFRLEKEAIDLGETLSFSFSIESRAAEEQRLVIDYAIHHRKASGSLTPKVFKLRNITLTPGESIRIGKKHAIKKITTRRYYCGEHLVEILINGRSYGRCPFQLEC